MSEAMMRAQRIREQARGRWPEILAVLGIQVPTNPKKHTKCPKCGGKDRFRFDDKNGTGTFYCNRCDPKSGNGFHLVMQVKGVSIEEATDLVEDVLKKNGSGKRKPASSSTLPRSTSTSRSASSRSSTSSSPITVTTSPPGILGKDLFLYQFADGKPESYAQRKETDGKKHFCQWGPDADGTGWQPNLEHLKKPRCLYNLPEIVAHPDALIIVHEGERCVEAHKKAGLPGIPTTSAAGAKNAKHTDWGPLRGRRVMVVPDHDDDGERYGADVQRLTEAIGVESIRLLRLPNLPQKGDAVEWLAQGGTPDQFQALIDQLQPYVPPVTVPLADLITQIETILLRYISFPNKKIALLLAFWVVQTYVFEQFNYCGFLVLRSATPRCGKTKLLRLLSHLVSGTPPVLINITAATIYRYAYPVMLLDECDRWRNADKELFGLMMGVLNAGFERGSMVPRMNRDGGEMQFLKCYGPKVLSGIESIADTLGDRAFMIPMVRSTVRMPRLNLRALDPTFSGIRTALQRVLEQVGDAINGQYEQLPDTTTELKEFDERFQDISEPLLVLADIADPKQEIGLRKRLLESIAIVVSRRAPSGREAWLLAFLDLIEDQLAKEDKKFVETATLLDLCEGDEELAEIETGKALAVMLDHFDLHPRPNSEGTKRGYLITRDWFDTWRTRYPKDSDGLS